MTTQEIPEEWLSSLVAGHEWTAVIPYEHHRAGGRVVPVKVVRRTATQIIALVGEDERRYRAKDGRLVGDGWKKIPSPASEEAVAEARRENRRLNMAARLRDCDFKKLPYETLEAMFKLLPPQTAQDA